MESRRPLPKIGAVCAQWVRCGRSGCRCARGEQHGPYSYLFWRENGQLHKRYVRLTEAEALREEYSGRRAAKREMREHLRTWHQQWRRLDALLREVGWHG
jgi:hypothetical protein